MGLPEELYSAMLEVGHCARRHKIPGPLAHTMIDIAQKSLQFWRQDEKTAMRFAAGMLAGPTNLRATTGQLPEPVASACWRLVHQADLLFLPHDCVGRKTFRYALTVVDVASRWQDHGRGRRCSRIYRRGPLKWPKLLQVDPGREFMGAVSQLLAKHCPGPARSG